MFRPLRLLLCLLCFAAAAARADIKENFETAETDKPVAGQNGWKDGLHGGHPSCMVVAVEENGKSDKVLQSPAGGDFHVYRCFSAETLKPILDGRLITMSFRYKGNASLGIGITSQLKCDGITTTCGNGISVTAGKTAVSGIALLDPSQWNRVILIMAKEKDEILLTVGIESPQAAGEYNVVAGLGKVKLPFKADALEKWTGVYLRLDSGSMFDDLEISAYDNINSFPFKLKPSSLATMIKFKPVLDHLLPPRQAIDLSGLWEAAPAAMNSRTSPDTGWQPVLVPDVHSSLFKGKAPVVWFRRNFELKEKNPDQRYFLCFERVTDSCEVLVNGKAAGGSDDGFFPFRIDVTGALRPGSNQILVRVAGLSANGGPSIRPSGFSWLLGGFQGIPYPVHLESAGKIGIDDVFVIPRLQPESSLETRVTVTNRGDRTENFTLEAAAGTEFSHRPVAMALNPGESREVVLRDNWKQPELWWPHHPHLYYLDLKIKSGDKEIDAFRQRFGFREIQVKGPDIMLNGTRFIHRRNSIIPYWNLSGEETQKKEIALERERGYNGYRLHGGPSLRIVRTADELGWLVAPEAALCRPLANDVAPAFWPNAEKHIAGMVKALRNNPSIIYWCLSNEFASYFMKGTPEEKAVVDARMIAFGRMAEKLDPVHPWTCSGDGELGGWGRHGPAPTLSFHYPSEPFKQHFTIPAAVYWLEDGPNSWHGIKWDRTKPLIFSEDLFMPYGIRPPGGMARWAGDQAYDMNKGYYQGWFDCIRMYAEGYYHAKLAGWNPWATAPNSEKNPLYNLGQPMPDYLLATREQNVTFLSGEKVKRTLFAYNEMFESMNCKLSAELYSGSQICDSVEKQFKLDGGAMAQFDLTLAMPAVKEKTSLQWRLILTGNGRELTRRTYDYIVYPRQEHFKAPSGCALLSKETQILADIDFPKGRFSDLNAALKSGAGNLVVAQWQCSLEQDRKKLDAAVRNGLNVLWLEPAPGERLPLRQNPKGYEAFGFIRAPLDPAMKNLTDRDLALWRPSGYPVIAPFFKPAEGMFDILADAGTALQYAPLIRFYSGKGYYLLCSFPVISGYGKEPAAAYLAQQLIAAVDKTPQRGLHKLSIGEAGQATKDFFNKFGIPYSEGKPGKVYWAEGGRLSDAVIESIRACCSNGGTVIVDAVDPAATAKLMQLTGGKIVVNKANATSLLKKENAFPLLSGISNDDLYWRQASDFDTEAGSRVSGRKYVSKDRSMIDYSVEPGDTVKTPVNPGGIAVMPYLNGKIILLTLNWNEFLKIHPVRVSRLLVSLLHNLGTNTAAGTGIQKEYCFVDIKPLMNRELWQKETGGAPAWFGSGQDDLRYFPVNRPGIDPVNKLPQPAEAFPVEPVNLGGIDFQLVDPDCNQGRGCLIMQPGQDVTLPVSGQYAGLWLLGALESHAGNRRTVASLVFNYTDGSCETVPVLAGVHVNGYQYIPEGSSAVCAWSGYNPVRADNSLWVWRMENPAANKPLKSVTIKVGKDKRLGLIAVTGEK